MPVIEKYICRFNTNYGTMGWLDWLHGTDKMWKGTTEHKRHRPLWSFKPISELIPRTAKQDQNVKFYLPDSLSQNGNDAKRD